VFLVVAPGVAGGLVPWLLVRGQSTTSLVWLQIVGWVVLAAGAAVLIEAFGRFVVDGLGTPAPVAPPQKLVVTGLYRYVRNPMYLAVTAVILGQAAVFASWALVVYAAVFVAVTWSFVHWYEEPTLRRKFGADYETYLRIVPGWWPRVTHQWRL
jgi:protein-S-isoprenylcysteine O-methyltransferase Ste14